MNVINPYQSDEISEPNGKFAAYNCPHPKDGEGNVFTGVCLLTGGYPNLWSQVLSF